MIGMVEIYSKENNAPFNLGPQNPPTPCNATGAVSDGILILYLIEK
jgi:hypothetical protein